MSNSGKKYLLFIIIQVVILILAPVVFAGAEDSTLHTNDVIVSGNPIITHMRCADPAAEVWNDGQVWIYASHDPEGATDYSTMEDYHAYSSYDLVNWTDHGVILHAKDVAWGNSSNAWMFAPDAAYKDGTYYLYFPTMSSEWKWVVGVATSDRPEGPFTDVGHYIEGTDDIDPVCFMDDDGQAYLIWGGGSTYPRIAKLKDNMTELAEEPKVIDYGSDNFGEASYMHKRNGIYYFSYTDNTGWPYQGFYGMADNPYGPFDYKGELKRIPPGAQDHHSIIEYHGQWYYFYHVGNYGTNGSAFQRNICVDSLLYNPDGTMQEVIGTTTGVGMDLIGSQPGHLVPGAFGAENFFMQEGIQLTQPVNTSTLVTAIQSGDWIEYVLHILGTEKYQVRFSVSNPLEGSNLCVFLNGVPADTFSLKDTSSVLIDSLFLYKGKHTMKVQFLHTDTVSDLLEIDRIEFRGSRTYHSIEATAGEGGSLYPEGTTYYAEGDSAVFLLETNPNYVLSQLIIDGEPQPLSESFTFRDITDNHNIEAVFAKCWTIPFTAKYRIDDNPFSEGTGINITEGQDLTLAVDVPDTIVVTWSGPDGFTAQTPEIQINDIRIPRAGAYTVSLTNNLGCYEEVTFNVAVALLQLDVFEAEEFFSQSGTSLQPSTDLGGGWVLGNIDHSDWSFYNVSLDSGGIYNLTARVSTATSGGEMEVKIWDSLAVIIPVPGDLSDDWQDWFTTEPVEIGLQEGLQRLKFTFKGDDGYLFNFNWFDLDYDRPFDEDSTQATGMYLHAFPNPVITHSWIEFTLPTPTRTDLIVINSLGETVSTLKNGQFMNPGCHRVYWNAAGKSGRSLPAGMYFILLRTNETQLISKVVLGC